MKLKAFIRPAVSLALLAGACQAIACGPYSPLIPTPDFFGTEYTYVPSDRQQREENIRLWQSVTSDSIPAADILQAVYKDSRDSFLELAEGSSDATDNRFYRYLIVHRDREIIDFLALAKKVEERRFGMTSPWYYPAKRVPDNSDDASFADIIARCEAYKGERLRDRYALQMTRALFAAGRYSDVVAYCDSAFAPYPESNLFKRMAMDYVSGAWANLGNKEKADICALLAGNVPSIDSPDALERVAGIDPASPMLVEYIRTRSDDKNFMLGVRPLAETMVRNPKVTCKGDWYFTIAYIDYEYRRDMKSSSKAIYRAMDQDFSSREFRDLARAFKMKIDGRTDNRTALIDDLGWMEKMHAECDTAGTMEWQRRLGNIVYMDWIPQLWRQKDYSTAILLCSYADNFSEKYIGPERELLDVEWFGGPYPYYRGYSDYSRLAFRLMQTLGSRQLAKAVTGMMASDPLSRFLRRKVRTDRDYYYELIGTLALREQDYTRAQAYLDRVSDGFLRRMSINRAGYLSRDPFGVTIERGEYDPAWKMYVSVYRTWHWDRENLLERNSWNPRGKADFARRMAGLRRQMTSAPTADERGLARLIYAIGLKNSFDECWALTRYWNGWVGLFEPELDYWGDDFGYINYRFVYDTDEALEHGAIDSREFDSEVKAALAMLTSDEARARANYILGNLRTIVTRYPDTPTAAFVRTSCDNWRNWL